LKIIAAPKVGVTDYYSVESNVTMMLGRQKYRLFTGDAMGHIQ